MFIIEPDFNLLEKLKKDGLDQLKNTKPVYQEISKILKRDSEASFPNQKSPMGDVWEQSKAAKENNRLTLVDTHELSENLIFQNLANRILVFASDLSEEYGFLHQFGGVIQLSNGDEFKLPVRQYAGLSEEGTNEIIKFILKSFFN